MIQTIMVIDDEIEILDMLKRYFTLEGYHCLFYLTKYRRFPLYFVGIYRLGGSCLGRLPIDYSMCVHWGCSEKVQ